MLKYVHLDRHYEKSSRVHVLTPAGVAEFHGNEMRSVSTPDIYLSKMS